MHIKDVVCDGNNRQGISVISARNLLIEDTVLKNTAGTAPQAGIDFEPNHANEEIVNCVMRNCVSENNAGVAYALYLRPLDGSSTPISLRIENCVSRGSNRLSASITTSNGGPNGPAQGLIEFIDCRFEDIGAAGISVRDVPAKACRLRFENCTIADAAGKPKRSAPITFEARKDSVLDVGGAAFVNCVLEEPIDRPLMTFADATGELKPLGITGDLKVIRGGKTQTIALTEGFLDELFPVRTVKRIPRYDLSKARFVPALTAARLSSKKSQSAFQRGRGEYLVHANQGDEVELRVNYRQVGHYDGVELEIPVTNGLGRLVATLNAPFQRETRCSFIAPETGVFKLVCDAGRNRAQMDSSTHRLCLIGAGRPIPFIHATGDFYFWVPGDVAEFGVKVSGWGDERVNAAVFDPAGRQAWSRENIGAAEVFVGRPNKAGAGEIWRLRLDKPTAGAFEDFQIEVRGAPNVLAQEPEALLRPTKTR